VSGTLGRRLLRASGLLLVAVVLIFAAMLYAISDLRSSGDRAHRSEQVIAASNQMTTLVLNLETSQRGYVITHQEPFLGPGSQAWRRFPRRQRRSSDSCATIRSSCAARA